MSEKAKRAADVLVHYFQQVYKKVDLNWTSDNETEVRGIVEDIVQAAIEP